MARKKAPTKKLGVRGPHVEFNADPLLDVIHAVAKAGPLSRYATLKALLANAGFTDAPADATWRQWERRAAIPAAWLPTVLYAVLVADKRKITLRDLLKVHQ